MEKYLLVCSLLNTIKSNLIARSSYRKTNCEKKNKELGKQMSNDQQNQGGFPQNQSQGQSTHSTTGDGHPPRPGEPGYSGGSQGSSGGGSGSGSNAGQQETGGTGGYGGTSSGSGGSGGSSGGM
jgi:hypothetical protein